MTPVGERVSFDGELFVWSDGSWYFIQLPGETAADIRDGLVAPPRGFGSVRVAARIGGTAWRTSIFPHKDSGSYLLPVKKAVRDAEGIDAADVVHVELEIEPDHEEGTP